MGESIKAKSRFNKHKFLGKLIMFPIQLSSRLLLIAICFIFYAFGHASNVPELKQDIVHPQDLARFIGDGQLFVIFPQKKESLAVRGTKEKETFETRFVSSISVINASAKHVRSVINDYANYSTFMPQNDHSEVVKKTPEYVIARYSVFVKLPVFKIHAIFDLKHVLNNKGDITWTLIDGHMKASLGRWEIIPISEKKTLVINTSWSDHKSIGFISRMLMKAQPDLAMAVPIGTTALMLEAVKQRAERKKRNNSPDSQQSMHTSPNIPYISNIKIPQHTVNALLKHGQVLIVHPAQWIRIGDNEALDLVFTSSMDVICAPIEQVKKISTDVSQYPDIFYQVTSVTPHKDKMTIDWRLKLWFSLFSFTIDLTNQYYWENDNILTFTREAGDLEYVFGRREWISLGPEKTMIVFTTGFQGGNAAPFFLKFVKMLPNSQVVGSTSVCSVLMEKHIPWIESRLQNKKARNQK
jgi:ribosome-associated toxin RatA of RatAB toxin-antitoxin module